jgi:glycosyltransferase involved in cell wall biosynthesis
MNIAILVAGLPPERIGGAERQAAQIAGRLAERHTVRVLTRTATVPPELASRERAIVTRRSRVDIRGLRFGADIATTLAAIGRERRRIDVLVAYQTVIDGLIAVLAKRLFGMPAIVMVRCDTEYQLDRFAQSRMFSPFVFRHADRLGVQSATIGEELVGAIAGAGRGLTADTLRAKLFVLPNGIAPVAPRRGDGDGLLYVGRLTRPKAVDVLLAAMRELPGERLTIVGDGPERTALEQAARGLAQVSFAGRVAHARVAEYLAGARMLVLPSRQEGQPNVVMEAMALGVPVVATRVGGVPDLVADGETGLLAEPGDASGLARAIRTLSADAGLRARVAEASVHAMRQYDWPRLVEDFEGILRDVVAERDGKTGPHLGRSAF